MSGKAPAAPKGKLSYCLNCKDDTETIIISESGPLWPMKSRRRICRTCAQGKAQTELEVEKFGR
jgi:hypothetical protein